MAVLVQVTFKGSTNKPHPCALAAATAGDPCRTFDGVYCAWVLGTWRVVGVQLQLPAANVSFDDTAMSPGGKLAVLTYLRELEVLCVKQTPTPTPGGLMVLCVLTRDVCVEEGAFEHALCRIDSNHHQGQRVGGQQDTLSVASDRL
jgi:hypothetical protein